MYAYHLLVSFPQHGVVCDRKGDEGCCGYFAGDAVAGLYLITFIAEINVLIVTSKLARLGASCVYAYPFPLFGI